MNIERIKSRYGSYFLIAVFAVVAMVPMFINGVPFGPDQRQHFMSAAAVYDTLGRGDVYPSITGEIDHDFGYYMLRFYPPLTYYLLAGTNLIVRDWYSATLIVVFLSLFFGGVGMYFWAKEEYSESQGLIAAAIFVFAPYHLNQIYGSFLLAEFLAMAVLPFCFLFLTRVCRRGQWIDSLGLAVSYALLILMHLPTTIIGSIALGLYCLLLLKRESAFVTLVRGTVAVCSALLMTAFYWARMLPEIAWANHSSPKFFSDVFDYRTNFLFVPDHLLNIQDDARSMWFPEFMLFTTLIVLIPSIVLIIRKKLILTRFSLAVAGVLLFSLFIASPLSRVVWDNFSLLQKIQFPWRWMTIISIFGSILASAGILKVSDSLKTTKNTFTPIALGSILLIFFYTGVFITQGAVYLSRTQLNQQVADVPSSEGCDCWWPVWAKKEAFEQKEKVVAPGRTVDVTKWTPTEKEFSIGEGEPISLSLSAFYYPRWVGTADTLQLMIDPTENGRISFPIASGSAMIKLRFVEPILVPIASVVSAIASLFVALLGLVFYLRSRSIK